MIKQYKFIALNKTNIPYNNFNKKFTATSHLRIQASTKVSIYRCCGCVEEDGSAQKRTTSANHFTACVLLHLFTIHNVYHATNM